jgi:ABC transport system ATP-binding/permease protein
VPVLSAQDLHKVYGARSVLDGVSITIRTGEKVGVVGANGSGKSTLARILAGREPPDAGSVAVRRGADVAYLPQQPRLEANATARDIVVSGLTHWSRAKARYDEATEALLRPGGSPEELAGLLDAQAAAAADAERLGGWDRMHQVEGMLGHLGMPDPDVVISRLSEGEQRRVALAGVLVARPTLAVLDEPTNHLDVETIDWLERFLVDEYQGAVVLITHDRYLLDRVADRTVEVEDGNLYVYDGGYEAYLAAKAERTAHAVRVENNRQNFLRRELEWLSRQPKARSTKQKARIQRAEDSRATRPPKEQRVASILLGDTRTGKTILDWHDVSLELGGRQLVSGFDWALTKGERVGVVGRNGSGKTTLLRAILGEIAPAKGRITVGVNTEIAYFDQERGSLDPDLSVLDNLLKDHPQIEVAGQPMSPHSYLERFLFDTHKQRQPAKSLSGGERARAVLAKMLARSANLVLLDEPTNDLDVPTLGALEQMLLDFGGTSVVVTHDRWFLDRVATSILAFEGDGRVVRYGGNYGTVLRLRAERQRNESEQAADLASTHPKPRPSPSKPKGLTMAEKAELATIVDRIDEADRAAKDLEARLEDPALYAEGGALVRGVMADLAAARAKSAELVLRWEELEKKGAERPR